MKTVRKISVIVLAIALLTAVGCSNTSKVSMGELNGTTYTNDYFGLKFDIPADWTVATDEEKELITNAGQEAIAGEDKALDKQLELSKKKTLNLLFTFKYSLNYMGGVNPNFLCIAENLGLAGLQIKNGDDYLAATKTLMEQANMPYEFSDTFKEIIDNVEFSVMATKLVLGDIELKQKIYSAVMKGYALNFSITYTTDEELEELNRIIETIKF